MREHGYAFDHEEGNAGVSCIGAPIFGPLGEIVAALSVTGPTAVVRPDRLAPAVRMARRRGPRPPAPLTDSCAENIAIARFSAHGSATGTRTRPRRPSR